MRVLTPLAALWLLLHLAPSASQTPAVTYDDPTAAAGHPLFHVQGEYAGTTTPAGAPGTPIGVQVVAIEADRLQLVVHQGGLPGAGSDGRAATAFAARLAAPGRLEVASGPIDHAVLDGDALTGYQGSSAVWTARRATRTSPTLGTPPPTGAVVLFDGRHTDAFEGGRMTADGLLVEGTRTRRSFRDFTLHLEFRLPFKPTVFPGHQDRGNSGVYIFDRYEVQVLDSFGLHYPDAEGWEARFEREWQRRPPSNRNQWGGALYLTRPPDVAMDLSPLSWQTYDIDFTAPRFAPDGTKTTNARITVRHNGVLVHDDVELTIGTGAGGKRPEIAEGPIVLQDHANPVRFRNIWLVERQ